MPAQTTADGLFADVEAGQRVLLAYADHDDAALFHVLEDPTDDVLLRGVHTGSEILVETDTGVAFNHQDGPTGRLGEVVAAVPLHHVEYRMFCRRCRSKLDWYAIEHRGDGSEQYICADCAADHILGGAEP